MNDPLAVGYDVLIWIDEDGDIVCKAYTPEGDQFLLKLWPTYQKGDIMEIVSSPEEFFAAVPPDLNVGHTDLFGRVVKPFAFPRLQ